jgi:hypothetical protein
MKGLLLPSLAFAALLTGASAYAGPISFTECPPVGNDTTGCEFLITVTSVDSGGNATGFTVAVSSPDLGPFDGADDTLVGVLNATTSTLNALSISSPLDIFGFDGMALAAAITEQFRAAPALPTRAVMHPRG